MPDNSGEQHGLRRARRLGNAYHLLRGRSLLPALQPQPAFSPTTRWPIHRQLDRRRLAGAMGTILPGGFTVLNNKLYILGGFNINVASTNQIWEFDPTAA